MPACPSVRLYCCTRKSWPSITPLVFASRNFCTTTVSPVWMFVTCSEIVPLYVLLTALGVMVKRTAFIVTGHSPASNATTSKSFLMDFMGDLVCGQRTRSNPPVTSPDWPRNYSSPHQWQAYLKNVLVTKSLRQPAARLLVSHHCPYGAAQWLK